MAFGNGTAEPSESMTALAHEQHRCVLTKVSVSENSVIVEVVITGDDVGGFWIREIGVFDSDGELFAIGKYPATYKPLSSEGSVKSLGVKMVLKITNAPNVIVGFNNGVIDGANTNLDNLTFAGEQRFSEKAPLLSPEFTGLPRAPTAGLGANTTQIANVHWVNLTIAALIDSAPETLNTLKELSNALGDDPNFATTITNLLAEKATTADLTTLSELVGEKASMLDLSGLETVLSGAISAKLPLAGGTMTGALTAQNADPTTAFNVRNIKATTADPGVGSALTTGAILLIYENE
jgi:phage-related tail fiber protein